MADLACLRVAPVCVRAFYSTSAACIAEIYTEQTQVDDRQGNAGEPLMKRLYCTVDTLQRTGILREFNQLQLTRSARPPARILSPASWLLHYILYNHLFACLRLSNTVLSAGRTQRMVMSATTT